MHSFSSSRNRGSKRFGRSEEEENKGAEKASLEETDPEELFFAPGCNAALLCWEVDETCLATQKRERDILRLKEDSQNEVETTGLLRQTEWYRGGFTHSDLLFERSRFIPPPPGVQESSAYEDNFNGADDCKSLSCLFSLWPQRLPSLAEKRVNEIFAALHWRNNLITDL